MDLALIGMHQDDATGATGEINRMGASGQHWRRIYVVAGAGVRNDPQCNDRIAHCHLTRHRRGTTMSPASAPDQGSCRRWVVIRLGVKCRCAIWLTFENNKGAGHDLLYGAGSGILSDRANCAPSPLCGEGGRLRHDDFSFLRQPGPYACHRPPRAVAIPRAFSRQ